MDTPNDSPTKQEQREAKRVADKMIQKPMLIAPFRTLMPLPCFVGLVCNCTGTLHYTPLGELVLAELDKRAN